jgi:hypothetical protein
MGLYNKSKLLTSGENIVDIHIPLTLKDRPVVKGPSLCVVRIV